MNQIGSKAIGSAPSKINLILRAGAIDDRGYHGLATAFEAVSLREYVVAEYFDGQATGYPSVQTLVYRVEPGVEPEFSEQLTQQFRGLDDRDHLAVRAAHALGADGRVKLTVHKTVPVAGGMAGGSADAAASLVAVNDLLGLNKHLDELQALGRSLGADVPACLVGGICLGTGHGDRMTLLREGAADPSYKCHWWVAVFMKQGLSTPKVFGVLDELRGDDGRSFSKDPEIGQRVLESLAEVPDSSSVSELLENQLQEPAFALRPELAAIGEHLVDLGCISWLLSGSGPTVVGLVANEEEAVRIASAVNANPPEGTRGATAVWGPGVGARLERALPNWTR